MVYLGQVGLRLASLLGQKDCLIVTCEVHEHLVDCGFEIMLVLNTAFFCLGSSVDDLNDKFSELP